MTISHITDGEDVSDAVASLNQAIDAVNAGPPGGTPVPLPFFGNIPATGWTRPALSTFSTWLNQGDATATDNTGGLPLVIEGSQNSASGDITGKLKTIGAAPWIITVGMAGFAPVGNLHAGAVSISQSGSWFVPIILSDGTQAEALIWGSNNGACQINQYTDTVPESGNWSTVGATGQGFAFPDYFEWFRIVNDGTNLAYQIGPDGLLWFTIYTELVGAFLGTITHVGFGFDRYEPTVVPQAGTQIASILWQWVES